MSVIFPTTPFQVHLHQLPKGAEYITYRVGDVLTISAWMPNEYHHIEQDNELSNDDFFYRHCEECNRNCSSFLDNYLDDDDEVDWDHPDLEGHCNVYDNSYNGQWCPLGHTTDGDMIDFNTSQMVFEIGLSHIGTSDRFSRVNDTAYLSAGTLVDGQFKSTDVMMASNVFGHESNIEGICWGSNDRPDNLREIVTNYFTTPFNNDLVSLDAFENNSHSIRSLVSYNEYHQSDDIVIAKNADALILLDAGKDVGPFFHMLAADFNPLPQAPHIIIVPVTECTFTREGNTFNGYKTKEDGVGKSWFITTNGLLVGQM